MIAFIREIRTMNKVNLQDRTSPRVPSRPISDLDAAHAWLTEHRDCTGRIGVIGFCQGGGYALMQHDRDIAQLAGSRLAILSTPKSAGVFHLNRERKTFSYDPAKTSDNQRFIQDTVAFYQTASHAFDRMRTDADLQTIAVRVAMLLAVGLCGTLSWKLEQARRERATLVAQLDQRYKDRAGREKALGRDAKALQQLLSRLRAAAAKAAKEQAAAARKPATPP